MAENIGSDTALLESTSPGLQTFLIADVRGYTQFTLGHGDEAAARLASRFADIVQEQTTCRGGKLIELRGDEALCAFPSVRNAIHAAAALQQQFAEATTSDPSLPLRVGVGLDAGEAVPVKGGYRGAALNLAARLCALAGTGEILASDTVANLARKVDGITYAERGFAQLKGFADPVRVIEVTSSITPGPASSRETPARMRLPIGGFLGALPSNVLIGRAAELGRLVTAVDVVAGGTGQLVLMVGEPGVGKTRLAQQLTLLLRDRQFLVATGRCYEPQQSVPFYPFLEALATLFAAGPESIRAETTRHWPGLKHLLPDGGLSVGAANGGQEDQQKLFQATTAFITALAEQAPVALLLDDLHWADRTSLDLLQHLARHTRAGRVLLLGTYRDVEVDLKHPLEQALRDLSREGLVERVEVRRLPAAETASLIAVTMGEETVSDEFVQVVDRRTDGNPFFIQQVLRVLVERGDVYREEGRWSRKAVAEIEVPESVRAVIGHRIARLSEATQQVLGEASVSGQAFAFEDLQEMSGREEQELEQALDETVAAGLVREAGPDRYAFDHALTQQALYGDLSARRKRKLHLAAGHALERLPEQKRRGRAAELAWHFLQADDAESALTWTLAAGDEAEAAFAHGDAEGQYRTALELAQDLSDRSREAEGQEKLGGVLMMISRYNDALALLEEAARAYRIQGDLDAEARITARIGQVHFRRGTPEEGIAFLQPMLARLERDQPSRSLITLYLSLQHLFLPAGRYQERLAVAERAAALASTFDDDTLRVQAELWRGVALENVGRNDEARTVLQGAARLAEGIGDAYHQALSLVMLSWTCLSLGLFEPGKGCGERAAELFERIGDPGRVAYALDAIGCACFYLGDWQQARVQFERAEMIVHSLESYWASAEPLWRLGELEAVQGKWEEASRHLEEALARANATGNNVAAIVADRALANRDLLMSRPEEARSRLERRAARGGPAEFLDLGLAEAYIDLAMYPQAEELLTRSCERYGAQNQRDQLVVALCLRGRVDSLQARWEASEHNLTDGLAMARSLTYPYAEARLLYELGSMHGRRGQPQRAQKRLEEALLIFQRLGAQPYIERTELALSKGA